jgi:hypothetical protein
MQLSQLITTVRAILDDEILDKPRWTDPQLTAWFNEAQSEANRRIRYLVDNTLTQTLSAARATYLFPDGVIFLRRAIITGEDLPLSFTTYKEMDANVPGWETHTGTPTHIICDLAIDQYQLYPIPDAIKTLKLTAIVEPQPLTIESQLPARFTYGFMDWVCYRAYQNADNDKFNLPLSQTFLASFEQEFGPRSSAKDEIFNLRNMPFDNYDGNS